MKSVIIDRKKWLRGKASDNGINVLWDPNAKVGCCLGHAIHQIARCPWKNLEHIAQPSGFYTAQSFLCEYENGRAKENAFSQSAMAINDDSEITDEKREQELIPLFKRNGIELSFKN